MPNLVELESAMPVAPLKLLALDSCKELGDRVNEYLVDFRKNVHNDIKQDPAFRGYSEENYLIKAACPRFGSGEGKGVLSESVRGKDVFLMVDVCNHSLTYTVNGCENHKSPDDHYQDLKRMIAAIAGKAHRINVIMPFLYESRQHKRNARESLDCALALQELSDMGVESIITFDAHDPRVQNAIPLKSFETVPPIYQFIKAMLKNVPDLHINSDKMMIISPDEGAMSRAVYFANVLNLDIGMFYKRRDYSTIINGRNPIVAHEFLGSDIEGKDVVIIDDMISSGESAIDVAKELKRRKANRIFIVATFGLFSQGLDGMDMAYNEGLVDSLYTTNLTYCSEELLEKPYYKKVDMSEQLAELFDTINYDASFSALTDQTALIKQLLNK